MKCTSLVLSVAGLAMTGAVAIAQHAGHGKGHAQPYAGQQSREVASLSAEEIEGWRAGRGMGLARPAELNGHPGPMHVLELAGALQVTDEQKVKVQNVFDRMKVRAQTAGAAYLAAEREVDSAFRAGSVDASVIALLVREADTRRADVRLAHLEAHLEMSAVLTSEQKQRYAKLRGYAP